jgi:small subunit ribosomal protein S13
MRIAGVTLQDKKRMEIALTGVYGIGRPMALRILSTAKIDPGKLPTEITPEEENVIREAIEKGGRLIEGELRRSISSHIKRLKDIGSYRGSRHTKKLPVRGQRTKTNARTLKGKVRTMGSGRRKVEKK